MKQMRGYGVADFVFAALALIVPIATIWLLKTNAGFLFEYITVWGRANNSKETTRKELSATGQAVIVISFALFVVAALLILSGILRLTNPEYYAIRDIIWSLK